MTTTPVNIDYNGLTIPSQNNDISITLTMDGSSRGLIFEYDKTTANPKTFKITSAGMNFTDNTNNLTTPLANIALLQTVLDALELPPDTTTLKVENTLRLQDGVNYTTIGNTGGNLNINCSTGQVQFSQTPHSANPPTTANDLTNKSYVDGLFSITNVNNNQDYYPLFVAGAGTGVTLLADTTTGPYTFNPSNGRMSFPGFLNDPTIPAVRLGTNATTGTYGSNVVSIGTNAGAFMGSNTICIGQDSGGPATGSTGSGSNCVNVGYRTGRFNQADYCVCIGDNAGRDNQKFGAIAVGTGSGVSTQGQYAVAIGYNAGNNTQGDYAIAIGNGAGQNNQPANSICINGTASGFNGATGGTCIRPIRGEALGIGVGRMKYNTTTYELTYSTT